MILFLDTTGFDSIEFALLREEKEKAPARKKFSVAARKKFIIPKPQSETILAHLESFLKQEKIKPKQLSAIILTSGSGSFTGIRTGFAHALAFSLALQIPLFTVKKERLPKNLADLPTLKLKKIESGFSADYGRAPKITLKRG